MRLVLVLLLFSLACPGAPAPPAGPAPAQVAPKPSAVTEGESPLPAPSLDLSADRGVFSDLAGEVVLGESPWIDRSAALVIANARGEGFVFVAGQPIAFAGNSPPDIVVTEFVGADVDGDQIPDQFDILIGAKKAELNNAAYGSPYREISYPGGDVPREEGVCTDTVVRAVRNAGIDLQQTLYEDIVLAPDAFPMVKRANPNIDHRRVKTLLPHFHRQWVTVVDHVSPWMPGDVVFMQTMGDPRPDHIGIVTDTLGASGAPLVINNWTDGYTTSAMDIAKMVPITHRFRFASNLALPTPHGGLHGLLHRHGLTIPARAQQLVVVTGVGWDSIGGTLRRYDRRGDRWVQAGDPVPVTVGASGLGAGRGLHSDLRAPIPKREGDRRAPAGIFRLGTAFGRAATPYRGTWPYRRVTAADRFVDDPASPHYNTWQVADGSETWTSAEALDMYELGLVVEHNTPAEPGAGSAIFLHTWQGPPTPTLGCTAMAAADLRDLLAWLDPARHPLLVQIPGHIFATE